MSYCSIRLTSPNTTLNLINKVVLQCKQKEQKGKRQMKQLKQAAKRNVVERPSADADMLKLISVDRLKNMQLAAIP